MLRIFAVTLVVFSLTVSVFAQVPQASALVGKWAEMDGGKDQIQFTADGKLVGQVAWGIDQGIRPFSGRYFTDGDKVAIKSEVAIPMTWEYKFKGDILYVTYTNGGEIKVDMEIARFRRVK